MKYRLGDAGFLFASTLIVNAGNYMINLVLGRVLGPARFAEASVIATAVLMLSFFAVGIQLTSAKFSASYFANGAISKVESFDRWISKRVWAIGLLLALIIIFSSRTLQGFLHFDSILPIIIIGIGIPFYFNMSVKRGIAQGTDQFKKLALTYLLEMLLRLAVTFGLILLALKFANQLTSEAVSLGFLISFFAAIWIRRTDKKSKDLNQFEDKSTLKKFVGIILIYEFSQILINNSDVILAKHFFDDHQAGLYAAIALIGRVVFFGTWTIVTLLFPKVIQREQKGLPHLSLFWISFGITVGFGLFVIIACLWIPEVIISTLFGTAYVEVSPLLWKYALATCLFAAANVFTYYYMSLSKYWPVVFSVVAGISQLVLISLYHNSIEEIIWVQVKIMSCLLFVMTLFQIGQNINQVQLHPKTI